MIEEMNKLCLYLITSSTSRIIIINGCSLHKVGMVRKTILQHIIAHNDYHKNYSNQELYASFYILARNIQYKHYSHFHDQYTYLKTNTAV